MHYDEKHSPTGISPRGVAAAWACCTLVAVGALLVAAIDTRDDRSIAVYAGAHIPKASSAVPITYGFGTASGIPPTRKSMSTQLRKCPHRFIMRSCIIL